MSERYTAPSRITAGFVAFLAVTLIALIKVDKIDLAFLIFIYASSFAIPALFAFLYIGEEILSMDDDFKKNTPLYYAMSVSGSIGYLSGFVGVAAIFWHYNTGAAIIFIINLPIWIFVVYKVVLEQYSKIGQ